MKKNSFLFICCFASFYLGLVCACKKDSSSNSYLRGKIDGVSFECNSNIWATPSASGDQIISFRGDSPPHSLRFYLDGQGANITTGTYNFQTGDIYNVTLFENNDSYAAGYFCGSFSPCEFMGSGKITFLIVNRNLIQGTFEFTGVDTPSGSKTVTDGEFSIKR